MLVPPASLMSKSVPQDKQATLQAVRMSFQKVKIEEFSKAQISDCDGPWTSLGNSYALELLRHDGSTTFNGADRNSSGKAQTKCLSVFAIVLS